MPEPRTKYCTKCRALKEERDRLYLQEVERKREEERRMWSELYNLSIKAGLEVSKMLGPSSRAVVIRPATQAFARWLRSNCLASPHVKGGAQVGIPDGAHAPTVCAVLRNNGVKAEVV